MLPVDKNRSTTGGQSGPSYLPQWPQQEDSPDHAYWGYMQTLSRRIKQMRTDFYYLFAAMKL